MNMMSVGAVGFSLQDQEKLKKIFQLSQDRSKSYAFKDFSAEKIDILMVNTDDLLAVGEQTKRQQAQPELVVVTVSRNISIQTGAYHIKPPLLSVRVLRVLDQIDVRSEIPVVVEPASVNMPVKMGHAVPVRPATQPGVIPADTVQPNVQASMPVNLETSPADYQVLVVDDSPTMQKALQIELQRSSISVDVECAASGEEALQKVEAKIYDFVFLDIMMPGIDGYETCKAMRKRSEMKKTPIIMLSAKTSPLDEVKGIMAGSTTYLTKPIEPEEFQKLLVRVGGWLGKFSRQDATVEAR